VAGRRGKSTSSSSIEVAPFAVSIRPTVLVEAPVKSRRRHCVMALAPVVGDDRKGSVMVGTAGRAKRGVVR
jgi:hypothetical protein